MPTKRCSRCGGEKDLEAFYQAKGNADGRQKWCKQCDNDRKLPYQRARQRRLGRKERVPQRLANELRSKGLKRCPLCKEVKPLSSFYEAGKSNGGYAAHCIICVGLMDKSSYKGRYPKDKDKIRDAALRRKFGITLEQYLEMLGSQGGVCAICGGKDAKKNLAVDHNHHTGRIRGLLCGRCNPAVGYLLDSAELAVKLLQYLAKYGENTGELPSH